MKFPLAFSSAPASYARHRPVRAMAFSGLPGQYHLCLPSTDSKRNPCQENPAHPPCRRDFLPYGCRRQAPRHLPHRARYHAGTPCCRQPRDHHRTEPRRPAAGARAFLVGESLMRQPDAAAATRALLALARHPPFHLPRNRWASASKGLFCGPMSTQIPRVNRTCTVSTRSSDATVNSSCSTSLAASR